MEISHFDEATDMPDAIGITKQFWGYEYCKTCICGPMLHVTMSIIPNMNSSKFSVKRRIGISMEENICLTYIGNPWLS